jgi:hypothetical protein
MVMSVLWRRPPVTLRAEKSVFWTAASYVGECPSAPPPHKIYGAGPFYRQICLQTQQIATQCPDQKPNGFRQPGLLPFSARRRCYLGNLGSCPDWALAMLVDGGGR